MTKTAVKPPSNDLYETDFYAWTQEQARLLRERRFDDLDLDNVVEEMASVGRSQRDQIESRLVVLLAHLLKWKFQPGARSGSWQGAIREQRRRIARLVQDSPSLHAYPAEVVLDQYLAARLAAVAETGIDFTLFPEACPFSATEILDQEFLPKEPDFDPKS